MEEEEDDVFPHIGEQVACLVDGICKWPIGEIGSIDFCFCGAQTEVGHSYCPEHTLMSRKDGVPPTKMEVPTYPIPTPEQKELATMITQSALVFVKAGAELPEDFVRLMEAKFTSARGVAVATGKQVQINSLGLPVTWNWIRLHNEKAKKANRLYCFHKFENGFSTDDIQPFELVKTGDGKILAACVMNGDYSNHAKAQGSHTNEFYATKTQIVPMLNRIFNLKVIGEDPEKFFSELKTPTMQIHLGNVGINNRNLFILTAQGDLHNYSEGEVLIETEWGWTTDDGFSAPAQAETKEEEESEVQSMDDLLALDEEEEEKKAPSGLGENVLENKTVEPTKTDVAVPKEPLKEGRPPQVFKTKTEVAEWYRQYNADIDPESKRGRLPHDFMKRPKVKIKPDHKDLKSLDQVIAAANKAEADSLNPSKPLIPNEEVELLEKMLAKDGEIGKMLDANSTPVTFNPEEIKAQEVKFPTFAARLGREKEGLNMWGPTVPFEAFLALVNKTPKAAAVLLFNFRNERLILQDKKPKKETEMSMEDLMKLDEENAA